MKKFIIEKLLFSLLICLSLASVRSDAQFYYYYDYDDFYPKGFEDDKKHQEEEEVKKPYRYKFDEDSINSISAFDGLKKVILEEARALENLYKEFEELKKSWPQAVQTDDLAGKNIYK